MPARVSVIVSITHRLVFGVAAVVVVALLAACTFAGGSASGTAGETPSVNGATPTVASSSRDRTAPSPTPDTRPLQGLLPSDFGGTEAHTFAVGHEMLARLAAEIGVAPANLEVAFASDHGTAFVQMYALRAAGVGADEILSALPAAAYPGASGSVTVSQETLAGRTVTVISEPSAAALIGTFYCLADGQVLICAQALEQAVAEAALEEHPGRRGRDY